MLPSDSSLCTYESEGNPDATYTYRNPLIPVNISLSVNTAKGRYFYI